MNKFGHVGYQQEMPKLAQRLYYYKTMEAKINFHKTHPCCQRTRLLPYLSLVNTLSLFREKLLAFEVAAKYHKVIAKTLKKIRKSARTTNKYITFATTHHVTSCKWWWCEPTIFSSSLTTGHMASCGKICVVCGPNIFLKESITFCLPMTIQKKKNFKKKNH